MRRKSTQKRAGHVDMVQAKHSLKRSLYFFASLTVIITILKLPV